MMIWIFLDLVKISLSKRIRSRNNNKRMLLICWTWVVMRNLSKQLKTIRVALVYLEVNKKSHF